MNKKLMAILLTSSLFGCSSLSNITPDEHSEKIIVSEENLYASDLTGHQLVHENLLSVNYIKAVKILTAKSWIGTRVYKVDTACFEVKRDIQVSKEHVGFSDVINAAAIPDYYEVGTLVERVKAVGCDSYEIGDELMTTY